MHDCKNDAIVQKGWEPNQRATILKFVHGMKPNRNPSFSRKNSPKMQFARPFGPKSDDVLLSFICFMYVLSYLCLLFLFMLS